MIVGIFIHQNHRCPDLSPSSSEWSLRTIWGDVSQAVVLILLQIKLNSQLSHWAFFVFKQTAQTQGWRSISGRLPAAQGLIFPWASTSWPFAMTWEEAATQNPNWDLGDVPGLWVYRFLPAGIRVWGCFHLLPPGFLSKPQAFLLSHPCPTHNLWTRQKN